VANDSSYINKMKNSDYPFDNFIVAYLDILGFSDDLIDRAIESKEQADEIIKLLDDSLKIYSEKWIGASIDEEKIRGKLFSDCVCISFPLSESAPLRLFLAIIGDIQRYLALNGIFIRGGVAIGKHFENERMIFSQGLVKAYKYESKAAIWPRIIVDFEVVELVGNELYPNFSIACDSDEYHFIDYLDIGVLLGTNPDIPKSDTIDNCWVSRKFLIERSRPIFIKHKGIVERKLVELKEDLYIQNKYDWVRRYHNAKCKELFPNEEELLIGEVISGIQFIRPNLTFEDAGYNPGLY
jgi:hypothetical protein